MKKIKKGFTLVEVLVASAIFTIVFVAILATYQFSTRAEAKQTDYIQFENIMLNIDKVFDDSSIQNWKSVYFGEVTFENPSLIDSGSEVNSSITYYYYDAKYNLVNYNDEDAIYRLIVDESRTPKTYISVLKISDSSYILEDIDFGVHVYSGSI